MRRGGENVALAIDDHAAIVAFCRARDIGLVVVGPEAPLVAGVADDLAAAGIVCFGPSKAAAQLEGSKGFAKDFCREFAIPTGDYRRFTDASSALAYVRAKGAPIVVKADGLAAGKGVVVAMKLEEAEQAIRSMFAGAFGGAGAEVVVEDYLDGEELSFFALCDGTRALPLAGAQDHKRVGDGDTGPNTGGMGAYSPPPLLTPALSERVMREIVEPTVAGMAKRGAPFRGVLFAGLMVGADGPKLIEYNVRFGDPEIEAILARLDDDLLEFLLGCARGHLPDRAPRFSNQAALTVVMAARGYPRDASEGDRDPRPRRSGAHAGRLDPARRHAPRRPNAGRRRRPRAGGHGGRPRRRRGAGARLRWRRSHRLARRLLPARHRLARHRGDNKGRLNGRRRDLDPRPERRVRTDRRDRARQRRRARPRPHRRARGARRTRRRSGGDRRDVDRRADRRRLRRRHARRATSAPMRSARCATAAR